MNIWVIGRSYPTKKNNMRGSFEVEQAQLLAKHGNNVTYLASVLHPFNKVKKWGLCKFCDCGINVYTLSIMFTPERMHIHSKILMRYMWKRLFDLAEQEQGFPDVIHVHYPGMNSIPDEILPYQERGCKIVITDHWTKTLNNSMDSFQRRQLIRFVDVADHILCVGDPLRKAIYRITNTTKKIHVVPNLVSNLFNTEGASIDKDIFNFIVVGRLAPVKQVDKIIVAFSEAFRGNLQVHLTIVGGGHEKMNIENTITQLGIVNQVTMLGTLSREETAKHVKSANALICYSKCETFGVPIIEAWACGKPAIASDALGFIEYWEDSLGYIVNHNNIESLKNGMMKLYNNRDNFDPITISNFSLENFGEEAIYNRLINIYQQ